MSSTVAPASGLTAAANLSSCATVARDDQIPTVRPGILMSVLPSACVCADGPTGTQCTLSLDCSSLTVRPTLGGSTVTVKLTGIWLVTRPPPLRLILLSVRSRTGFGRPMTWRYRPAGSTITRIAMDPVSCGLNVMANRPRPSVVAVGDTRTQGPLAVGALWTRTCRPLPTGLI